MDIIRKNKKTTNLSNKVLDSISKIKGLKFEKIDTGNVIPYNKEKLYFHQAKGYEIQEVASQFGRVPLRLDEKDYKFDRKGKEYLVFSQNNKLIQIYPNLKLAKDLIGYSVENNIDFSKDSLDTGIHYKPSTLISKNLKKANIIFNKIKEETHDIRKTGQTGGGGGISKGLSSKVKGANNKLAETAFKAVKYQALDEIEKLSSKTDYDIGECLDMVIIKCMNARNFTDKFDYNSALYDNSVLRISNTKFEAVANFIGGYCNKNERIHMKRVFQESDSNILKAFNPKYSEVFI